MSINRPIYGCGTRLMGGGAGVWHNTIINLRQPRITTDIHHPPGRQHTHIMWAQYVRSPACTKSPLTGGVGVRTNVLGVICKHHWGIILHNEALQRLPALASRAKFGSERNKSPSPPTLRFPLTPKHQPPSSITRCDNKALKNMGNLTCRHWKGASLAR